MLPIIRFECRCGVRDQPATTAHVVRGNSDRYAVRCTDCGALRVGTLDPWACTELMDSGAQIIGDADLDALIEPADLADLDNPPCE